MKSRRWLGRIGMAAAIWMGSALGLVRGAAGQVNDWLLPGPNEVAAVEQLETAGSSWTTGDKSLLYIRVDFSDMPGDPVSQATVTSNMAQVNANLSHYSYGLMTLPDVTVSETFRMPQTAAWYGENNERGRLRTDALAAASAAGYNTDDYWSHIFAFDRIDDFSWAGLAFIGAGGVWLNGAFNVGVITHELGHNLGARHSSFWDTTDPADIIGPGK